MNMLELAFTQEPLFFIVASTSTLFFVMSLVLMLTAGGGSDYDTDFSLAEPKLLGSGIEGASGGSSQLPEVITANDIPTDVHLDSAMAFKVFSTQSVLAFMMGFGWSGLAARMDWGLPGILAFPIALATGAVFMLVTAWLFSQVFRLNHVVHRNIFSLIGQVGKAYTTIPEAGEGAGQIQISYYRTMQTLPAKSDGEAITAFDEVEVVAIERDSRALIVRKK